MFQILGMIAPFLSITLNGPAGNALSQTLSPAMMTGIRQFLVVTQYTGQYIDEVIKEGIKFVKEEVSQYNQK